MGCARIRGVGCAGRTCAFLVERCSATQAYNILMEDDQRIKFLKHSEFSVDMDFIVELYRLFSMSN